MPESVGERAAALGAEDEGPPFVTIQVAPTTNIGALAASRLALAVRRSPAAYLGMATGSTPKVTGFWEQLRQRVGRGELDLSQATFVNPDEWIGLGNPEHAEAYRSYLKKELAFETNILVPDGCSHDPVQAALDVETAIVAGGGFEWMLMGMGINGHIGFFEPAEALPSQAFTPAIDELNRARYATDHFGTIDAVPTHATTIGLGTVMRAKEICLCVVGEGKAELLVQALQGPITTALPASFVQLGRNVKIFLDAAAASKLDLAALAERPGWAVVQ
jgi:glucosamine-6-phosphate deaminase